MSFDSFTYTFWTSSLRAHYRPSTSRPAASSPIFTPRYISPVARKCAFPQRNNPPIAPIRTTAALRYYGRSEGQSCFILFSAVVREKSQVCTVIRRKTLPFLGNSARIAPAHNNLIADGSLWKTLCKSLLVSRKTFCVFHIFRLPYYRQDSRSKHRVRLYPRRQLLVDTKSKASREEKKLAQRLDLFAFHIALDSTEQRSFAV